MGAQTGTPLHLANFISANFIRKFSVKSKIVPVVDALSSVQILETLTHLSLLMYICFGPGLRCGFGVSRCSPLANTILMEHKSKYLCLDLLLWPLTREGLALFVDAACFLAELLLT